MHPEGAAVADVAGDRDTAAVRMGDVFDDGEAQAGAAEVATASLVDAVEALEEPGQVLSSDAGPWSLTRMTTSSEVSSSGHRRRCRPLGCT